MTAALDPLDIASLFSLREIVTSLDPAGPPTMTPIAPVRAARSVAIMPGSFNPPTAAHLLLAERAEREEYDAVVLVLARSTVGKEQTGMIPEDRLLAMRAACGRRHVVAACSHGLYADQAEAAAALFPGAEITFLVGSDKVEQIFQDRWYQDRELALERLFSRARLLAAPRGPDDERLRAVLEDPANKMWARRVDVMRLHPAVSDLSSTRVRGLLRAGADPNGLVPVAVAPLLAETRAYAPPMVIGNEEVDAYALRARTIDLLWRSRDTARDANLRTLMRIALSPTEPGRRLRALIEARDACAEDLARAV